MSQSSVLTPLNQPVRKSYSRPSSRLSHARRQARSQYPLRIIPGNAASNHNAKPTLTVSYRDAITEIATPSTDSAEHMKINPHLNMQQRFDVAFSLYNARAREEIHELHALCASIAHEANDEKKQWQALCARVMHERDACRVKLQDRAEHMRCQPSASDSSASVNNVSVKQEIMEERIPGRGLKRSADHESSTTIAYAPPPCSPQETSITGFLCSSGSPIPNGKHSASHPSGVHSFVTPPRRSHSPPPITPMEVSPTPSDSGIRPSSPSPSASESQSDYHNKRHLKRLKSTPQPESHDSDPAYDSPSESKQNLPVILDTANARRTPAPPLTEEFTHVDLMYNRQMDGSLVCRACLFETEKSDIYLPPTTFPAKASWDALRHHCVYAHPTECADVARLHPAEIFHLRQRMNAA